MEQNQSEGPWELSHEFDVPLSSGPFSTQLKTQVLKFYLVKVEVLYFNWSSLTTRYTFPSLAGNSLLQYLMDIANLPALETLTSLVFTILAWLEKSCFFSSCPTFCGSNCLHLLWCRFLHLQMCFMWFHKVEREKLNLIFQIHAVGIHPIIFLKLE